MRIEPKLIRAAPASLPSEFRSQMRKNVRLLGKGVGNSSNTHRPSIELKHLRWLISRELHVHIIYCLAKAETRSSATFRKCGSIVGLGVANQRRYFIEQKLRGSSILASLPYSQWNFSIRIFEVVLEEIDLKIALREVSACSDSGLVHRVASCSLNLLMKLLGRLKMMVKIYIAHGVVCRKAKAFKARHPAAVEFGHVVASGIHLLNVQHHPAVHLKELIWGIFR